MNGALIKSDDNMLPAPNQPSIDVSYFNQHELMYYERNGYRHLGQEFNLHVTLRAFAQMPSSRQRAARNRHASCAVLVIMPTAAPVYQIGEAHIHAATLHVVIFQTTSD